jgi:peptidoglycan/xylan/chitin deacetylase (PgdA/CDA1 family)
MNNYLTVIMYHYVRPIKDSRYPQIKGLEFTDFVGQLDYIKRYYNPVSIEEVLANKIHNEPLPERPILLTFDDGYTDHYQYVFPELKRREIKGAFYPVVNALEEHRILDVNKIHYLLASVESKVALMEELNEKLVNLVDLTRIEIESFRNKYYKETKWDPPEVGYSKKVLQHGLPEVERKVVLNELFKTYVREDEVGFAQELYLNQEQLAEMVQAGMHFGGHGVTHRWLDKLGQPEKSEEISGSVAFLSNKGCTEAGTTFCYPFGGYDVETVDLLEKQGCELAFTTEVDLFELKDREDTQDWLRINRLDTNHIPRHGDAEKVDWTRKAGA